MHVICSILHVSVICVGLGVTTDVFGRQPNAYNCFETSQMEIVVYLCVGVFSCTPQGPRFSAQLLWPFRGFAAVAAVLSLARD